VVDDRVGPGREDGRRERAGIERLGDDRLGAEVHDQPSLVRAAHEPDHLVTAVEQQGHEHPSNHAGAPGHEDFHRTRF
jgi:hypothetical protein